MNEIGWALWFVSGGLIAARIIADWMDSTAEEWDTVPVREEEDSEVPPWMRANDREEEEQ